MKKNKKYLTILMIFSVFNFSLITPLFGAQVAMRSGSSIQLELTQSISSENMTTGQSVSFRATTPIIVDGKTLVAAGAIATGSIENADDAGIIGAPGELAISLRSVTAVDGTQVPLSASKYMKGKSKATTSIVVGLFLCWPFLFMKGGDAELQAGSVIQATVIGTPMIEVED